MSPVDLRDSASFTPSAARPGRILALDLARGAALVAMAVFHFVFDLEMFGWVAQGTSTSGGWRVLAVTTAGSFLFLAGVSLWLAQGQGRRWRGFWRRFAKVAGAAALISAVTFPVLRDAFIFFGILHSIAAASLVGMLLLRLPALALAGLAALAFVAPQVARAELFDPWWLWWTGLQTVPIRSVDYVPLAPWLGPFLLGLAAGRIGTATGLWHRLAAWRGSPVAQRLAWPGRHSLIVYLAHQPVLIALVGSATFLLR
ncbi:heparan-alpha-glucosaminide N-acetyltransferase [Roseibacterium sp. SDUM158017]|uniref:heparan-alpha-glucosaminide N-acetyltransferase n=1 Tax=Roseicyclus salinarum TaxID=3036773 RepID=UPI0024158EAE|nr:heparan-alpha-glucosaminide N-acetyltransferase [Roseibacterium sp. SDUM158017]MDG4648084.1 heparan-alpha-glucosaminide N-acetyltransferase [Roseibacterium sp. SDUM158017]